MKTTLNNIINKSGKYILNQIEDFNYNIIKSLGYSPFDLINHNDLRKPFIEWKYGSFLYKSLGLAFLSNIKLEILTEFINSLKDGYTYAVTPILITLPNSQWGSRVITLDSQQIITNKTDINQIDNWLNKVHELNYLLYGNIINEGSLILRYRIISLSNNIYDRINDKDLIQQSNVPLKKYNPLGIEEIHLSNKLYPNSMNLNDYGILIITNYEYNDNIYYLYQYKVNIQILIKDIISKDNIINRECIILKNKLKILSYIDIINKNSNIFIRKIGNNILTFNNNGKLLNKESLIKFKYISKEKIDLIHDTKIITFDIECYLNNNNKFIPYACGYSDGINTKLYYLSDYKNEKDMLYNCIIDILNNYNKYTVYVHNFSNFDYYLILDMLVIKDNINYLPFYKDNKLYSLKLTVYNKINNKANSIIIKDSYLLLKNNLRKLGKDYKVNVLKGYFPYTFVNEFNLNYISTIPDYYYYVNNINKPLNYEEYLNLKSNYNNNWSVKDETLNYLLNDLLCLYEVINKFSLDIFNLEHINITKILSISSLTFKIFKTNYLKDFINKLPIIKGIHHDRMRYAFYGGHVDVYTPIGYNIKYYDVNSLYPFVMSKYDFPIGDPVLSFDKDLNSYFGIIHCKVITPEYLDKPVLPFRGDDNTIYYPLGNWTGTYFSEELKNAVNKYGYKIEIIYGYKFEKGNGLFTKLVNKYYELKKYAKSIGEHSKSSTSKLLMNSLFGRFGMKPIKNIVKIVNKDESNNIHLYHNVHDNIPLNDQLEYIKYSPQINDLFYDINGIDMYEDLVNKLDINNNEFETSLPIAIAITAYARMYMNDFINEYNCYNTDTDSLAIDNDLPNNLIGDELGQFKLETFADEVYFISPKLYYLENYNLNKIIIKARTIGGETLSKQDFIDMSYGVTIKKNRPTFISNIKDLSVSITNQTLELNPILRKRYPYYSETTGQIKYTKPLIVNNGIIEKINVKINTDITYYKN